jgi:hypothetical protein
VFSFDAVKHLVLCRIEHRAPRLNLEVSRICRKATVATTMAKSYLSLLAGGDMSDTPQLLLSPIT